MASLLFKVDGAMVNALAFSDTNFIFRRLTDQGEEKRKRHGLALERLQVARDKWNKDRMKWLYFINKRPREKNEANAYISNVDEAILEYYRVFAKQIQTLPPESQLSYFCHPSEDQKNDELLCVAVNTSVGIYAL